MVGLGDLPGGGFWSAAFGVSADGSVVVGRGVSDPNTEAFRWTSGGGMVGLGHLPGGSVSWAYAASADGSVVVGAGSSVSGLTAFIWDSTNGIRNLKDVLTNDYGLDLTGWTLEEALDISDDGLTIVGYGHNPSGDQEAWRAVLGSTPGTFSASYGGMVQKDLDGKVSVDTGIWAFNPNTKKNLKARIIIYDKYGTQVATSLLYDGGAPALIPPMGYGWITLGMLVSPCEAQKFKFSLNFTKGNVLQVAPSVEIKEVIYNQPVLPDEIHNPLAIKCWSETSLGGPKGTGFKWQPVE
jgi:probable HAF family extracellular repeat protein